MAIPHFNGHYLTFALLIGCTIIGIAVAARFRREVDVDLAPTTAKDLLDPLEEAYFSGLMHPDEIERIRDSVKKSQATKSVVPPQPAQRPPATDDFSSMFMSG